MKNLQAMWKVQAIIGLVLNIQCHKIIKQSLKSSKGDLKALKKNEIAICIIKTTNIFKHGRIQKMQNSWKKSLEI